MGESDGGGGEVPVDCSVGTIVWVRRRNGSWWPGRILGPEELSASHLMSPRSGTPVKLLGRHDASVDWYNLEKSKRVKPFRCGEFDACIERVEASHGIPIKKREKYARREDAILHALELEKQQFEMKQKKLGVIPGGLRNRTSGVLKRDCNNISSEVHLKNDEPGVRSEFATQRTHSVSRLAALSHEEDNTNNSFYVQKGRDDKEFGWEDDVPAAVPRMRALQDFGLRIAPSKRKLSQFVSWETSCEPVDNHVDVLSTANHVLGGTNLGGSRKYSSSMKSKRPLGSLVEESLVKKRDRRRPLVQVLQSSVKLPDSHSFQTDYDGGVISMQGEKDHMGAVHRAKRSRCIYLPADSNDSLDHNGYHSDEMAQFGTDSQLGHPASLAEEYTSSGLIEATESESSERGLWEAEMDGGENLLSGTAQDLIPGTEDSDPSGFQITNKFENLENYVMPLSGHLHLQEHFADASAEAGVSKWHMKGKRNIRNLAKRPVDLGKSNGSVKGRSEPSNQMVLSTRGPHHREELSRGGDVTDTRCSRRYPFLLKDRRNGSDDESELVSQPGWEVAVVARRPYWGESDECFDLVYPGQMKEESEPLLVDVDLKVQTTYQGERVPLVSLMSRLNGKAIIGHPVQIEILEDGCRKASVGLDESTAPPPVWKTARRTAMQRVPRSNPPTLEDADPLHYPEPTLTSTNPFLKLGKNKPHKKLPKRVSLSSQKTRTLSSIATEQNRRGEKSRGSDILGGLIKPEGAAVMPLVTCVPVKVVFSRILEAVGRPYRVRTTSPARL